MFSNPCLTLQPSFSKKGCKNGLIVNDAESTYTLSLLHKFLGKSSELALTVIEHKKVSEFDPEKLKQFQIIQEMGAHLVFGIDATQLHETFLKGRFKKIYWNYP